MDILLSCEIETTCPDCGAALAFQAPLIVQLSDNDDAAWSQLLRIKSGVCPNGDAVTVEVPLLIHQPHRALQVLFVPAGAAPTEQDQADRKRLMDALLERLQGAGVAPDKFAVAVVPGPFLPLFLVEDKDIRAVAPALLDFLQAGDDEKAVGVIAEHPELFSDLALKALDFLSDASRDGAMPDDWAAFLVQRRDALQTLRAPALFVAALTSEGTSPVDSLATWLTECFQRHGDVAFLHEAFSLTEAAGTTPPAEHPPGRFNNLANMLSYRFGRLGKIADLEAAIEAAQDAIALTPDGHPDRPMNLNTLATILWDRFGQMGKTDDLKTAIEAAQDAVASTPDEHPHKPAMLNNLAIVLSDQFGRLDGDTAAFAVESIRRWWQRLGQGRYPERQTPPHHSRFRRQQRRAGASVEAGASEIGQRNRP